MPALVSPLQVGPGFVAAVEAAARAALGPAARVAHVEVMPGGHSGLTHRVVLDTGDGAEEVVVVKSTPPGRPPRGRHDVLRQARVIRALGAAGALPVPEVRFAAGGGTELFATDLVEGRAADPAIDAVALAPEVVAASWDGAIAVLAALHGADLGTLGLAGEPCRSAEDELGVWTATLEAARHADNGRGRRLVARLGAWLPPAQGALVHGDYRLGNLLIDDSGVARALIDWEIWSVTDPLMDLGWFVLFTDPGNFPGFGREVPGTPPAATVVARYLAATGAASRSERELRWYLAVGCLKLAAIQAHNRRRHFDGRYHDPYQERLGPSIDRLLERGHELLDGTRAA
jgi:aminoglycoside phosphotransferase (APT) family kinase protein